MNMLYIVGAMDSQSIIMIAILGVLMVLMLVMSIVPQRKRQKEAQKMMDSLKAGTKIKTIGGFIGEIKSIEGQNIVLDCSPNFDGSHLCVMDKSAVYTIMEVGSNGQMEEVKQEAPKALDDVDTAKKEEEPPKDEKII